MNQKVVTQNFIIKLTGDKYFSMKHGWLDISYVIDTKKRPKTFRAPN